jgi:ribose transport system substrate-binding protein
MRKTVLAVLALALCTVVAAQAGPRIALFNPLGNNDYILAAERGVRSIIEAAGGTVTAFDAGFDPAEQMNQLQDAVTAGIYDAFIVYSVDNVGMTVGADEAAAAGIPLIALDAPINADRRTLVPHATVAAQIARTGVGDGSQIGRAIVMACEGVDPCPVAFLIGFQGFPLDLDRLEAIEDLIAAYDHIDIVAVAAGQYVADGGFAAATDMLQANPRIRVIASVGDQMTLGAEQAVEDAGLVDSVRLIGNGASRDGYDAVAAGRWFATVANIPFTNGQIAAQLALQAIDGTLVIRSVDMYDQSPPIPSSGAVITRDNVGDFEPQW